MPVTITLSDDQALDIISQIGGMLRKEIVPPQKLMLLKASPSELVRDYVTNLPSGTIFRTCIVLEALKIPTEKVSVTSACAALIKDGQLKMIHRGTWKRL